MKFVNTVIFVIKNIEKLILVSMVKSSFKNRSVNNFRIIFIKMFYIRVVLFKYDYILFMLQLTIIYLLHFLFKL